ncbi:putative inactive shikimate kinase like 2, chloroplastic [Dorcoceras hygrometricum]|uniref:Putative inactive shikimate kinase like 2, chloroplastic n=1 Tax=Dorcoceras hygrometricum TaxID=472368 RepID=A0A2Z7A5F6_9LAMI|nr:putative inactive shikimate kinase like 2, chloroplastic [Dorcoceras hygrometricum]
MITALSSLDLSPNPPPCSFPATACGSLSTPKFLVLTTRIPSVRPLVSAVAANRRRHTQLCCATPAVSTNTTHYEVEIVTYFALEKIPERALYCQFHDDSSEVELRLELGSESISPKDIFVDANETTLVIKVQQSGYIRTLLDTDNLYGVIKPAETIWYIDDTQLVVNLKKQDPELKWPDIMESWESLTVGVMQLLEGASIFLVGESADINYKIARELAVGLGVKAEGSEAVAEAEDAILENLVARAVVATIGGEYGAARRPNKWRHLFAGFTVWLSQSEAIDEKSATEEAKRHIQDCLQGYANSEVVVKLGGWDANYSKTVAQASLSALKRLILSDKKLPGRKSLYIRLGCQGDWPDIKLPAGWDPSTGADVSTSGTIA